MEAYCREARLKKSCEPSSGLPSDVFLGHENVQLAILQELFSLRSEFDDLKRVQEASSIQSFLSLARLEWNKADYIISSLESHHRSSDLPRFVNKIVHYSLTPSLWESWRYGRVVSFGSSGKTFLIDIVADMNSEVCALGTITNTSDPFFVFRPLLTHERFVMKSSCAESSASTPETTTDSAPSSEELFSAEVDKSEYIDDQSESWWDDDRDFEDDDEDWEEYQDCSSLLEDIVQRQVQLEYWAECLYCSECKSCAYCGLCEPCSAYGPIYDVGEDLN
jgi:hypothetical protein